MTAGWPVAVHASLVSLAQSRNVPLTTPSATPTHIPLADYVAEEILDQLEPSLAEFILRATTCDWLGRRLAVELYGRPHGGVLLEECLRNGLFIEEHDYRGGESMYRWHALFAAQCRRIQERRDPLLAERLHRVAARYYQDADVVEGVAQALQGRAPRQAVMSLGAHWLEFVLGNDAQTLERLCRDLPTPWGEDPEILMVRVRLPCPVRRQRRSGRAHRRALSRTFVLDATRRRDLGWLPVLVRAAACRQAARTTTPLPEMMAGQPPDFRDDGRSAAGSTGLFLLAQAEFRLHRSGDSRRPCCRQPEVPATGAAGSDGICAHADLALAFAAAGDLVSAEEHATQALGRVDALGWGSPERLAPAWLARGIACYWNDELKAARTVPRQSPAAWQRALPAGPLSAIYRVLVDCATGDLARLADSCAALE